jgi:hypothetical protein
VTLIGYAPALARTAERNATSAGQYLAASRRVLVGVMMRPLIGMSGRGLGLEPRQL